jgi:hypothetical protein
MLTRQTITELRGATRRDFIGRIRQIVGEYMGEGLGPTAAMAEIRAALRELDRRSVNDEGRRDRA